MEKLLTVSVAAYNGAATLEQALCSCLIKDAALRDALDVIVVDDGSADETAAIAGRFATAYPGSFRLVRQANGGYGTTLNAAVALAKGRYFRTLDCDDWFDTAALEALLHRLADVNADAVFTDYRTVRENGGEHFFDVCHNFDTTRVYDIEEIDRLPCMEMHALTFCTKTLRAAWQPMPAHCSYTDMAYTFIGMQAANTLAFVPVALYQYRLGRDGQSVSLKSYRAHTQDYIRAARVVLDIAEYLDGGTGREMLLRQRARDVAQYMIEVYLRFAPSAAVCRELRAYDEMLLRDYPRIAGLMTNKNTRLLRAGHYLPYWALSAWARGKKNFSTAL